MERGVAMDESILERELGYGPVSFLTILHVDISKPKLILLHLRQNELGL
jgi:hypothetical protein